MTTVALLAWMARSAHAAEPFTVVIDAGHGGSNIGTSGGVRGGVVYEKSLTLQIARMVEHRLGLAGVRVVMTRGRDRYMTLRQRSRFAMEAHGDLFVSIHANASPQHNQRGIETFVLLREAAEVDARRNAALRPDASSALVAELAHLEARRQSLKLARSVQRRLIETRPAANRGVRQGSYDVLSGLAVPAILVEVGFLDHPIEGAELSNTSTQNAIAQSLAQGILDYVGADRRLAQNAAASSRTPLQ